MILAAACIALTEWTAARAFVTQFDTTILHAIRVRTSPAGFRVFEFISRLGAGATLVWIAAIAVLFLGWKQRWRLALGVGLTIFSGAILERILKWWFHRARPEFAAAYLSRYSYSFPSGHAMTSVIAYGILVYALIRCGIHDRRAQRGMVIGVGILVLTIAFSRLYLGVHYFSDVIAGLITGSLWLAICISLLEKSTPKSSPKSSQ
jgi:undecaprenyl-diphosphatase